ncbi:hypothetical protein H5410_061282 [Solanum commersonii]|uniref:Putative plant transposon protein domain-containing protein n=1 Tax=Solanum commersonii TaxID=4109 RepID=A0A9J5W8F6_SOLCO|nr:hypothetical protein H5410_061282 [Solanum commersonii]
MVAALVAELDINFPRLLLGELHKRAFKTTTTYPFPCMIFHLCRDAGVPIWNCAKLVHATGTLDIGLIQDDANVAALRRGPRVDVPMGEDLIHTTTNQASRLYRATQLSGMTMIPLARVQKLEGQMATLLHHLKPLMRKLIT